jgi:ssDNA-binding Zn-finger/Zn-ribbon topoisomerase 1
MTTCPECGAELSEGAARCARCGSSVAGAVGALRRCPKCGQEVDAAEAACPACGQLTTPGRCARHPEREAPGQCVICGRGTCAECYDEDQPHYLCPEHREIEVIEGWAQVYNTADEVEAQLIRENLRAEGVDAEILSQKDRMLTVDLGELAQVRVLVPAYHYAQARRMLAGHTDEQGAVAFACPSCGEAYAPEEQVCGSCGQPLPSTFA